MMDIKYVFSDLDGVIRHFPEDRDKEIEQRFGLSHGTLHGAAFEKSLLTRVVTGVISDEAWRSEIIKAISKNYSSNIAIQAVKEWSDFPGLVDHRYFEILGDKFPNVPIFLLTNGTSRLYKDLKTLQIAEHFTRIFNSAEIGVCKPDMKIFAHVVENLNCKPSDILFIDDSLSHVIAANKFGLVGYHYQSIEDFNIWCQK